jgi:hypothetical protein
LAENCRILFIWKSGTCPCVRSLTRYRYHLVGELVRVKSHALSLVYLQASDYTADPAFSNIFGKTSQSVLKEFPSM